MAALTMADIRDRVMNSLRIRTSDAEQAGRVDDIINQVYRDVGAKYRWWWWRQKRQIINTATPFDSGTVTATHGSVSLTFSSTPPSEYGSFANRMLIVDGLASDSGAVYRIQTHVAGLATAALDAPFSDQATTSAFTVYQDAYDLATDCASVRFVQRFGSQQPLQDYPAERLMGIKGWDVSEGKPLVWTVFETDTSGDPSTARQLVVHPYPDGVYRLVVFYEQTLNTELSGGAALLIPDGYAQVLVYGTLSRAYPILLNDTERGTYYLQLFNDVVNLMVRQQREQEGNPRVVYEDTYRQFYRRGRRLNAASADLGSFFDRWPNDP